MCFSFVGRHSLRLVIVYFGFPFYLVFALFVRIDRLVQMPFTHQHSLMRMTLTLFNRHNSVCVRVCFRSSISCSYLGSNLRPRHCFAARFSVRHGATSQRILHRFLRRQSTRDCVVPLVVQIVSFFACFFNFLPCYRSIRII